MQINGLEYMYVRKMILLYFYRTENLLRMYLEIFLPKLTLNVKGYIGLIFLSVCPSFRLSVHKLTAFAAQTLKFE